jgi:ubiquinone/menaquinone biosynthesis C-methylase UbiE
MAPKRDPEGREARYILRTGQIAGNHVLEVGCGEGWLTRQLADACEKITGIDPSLSDLQVARTRKPAKVRFISLAQAMGESLPFSSGAFDCVVFANSL